MIVRSFRELLVHSTLEIVGKVHFCALALESFPFGFIVKPVNIA
jgi:hypothetical protein